MLSRLAISGNVWGGSTSLDVQAVYNYGLKKKLAVFLRYQLVTFKNTHQVSTWEKNHCISILRILNAIIFYLIDYSIPICRLLLYSLSVLILVTMSSPEERPSFKDPSSPIGRVQSGLAALFLFESGNNVQANLPNNNIYKGKWMEEEHKIFMQEYEKYGNNCMLIAKVLST